MPRLAAFMSRVAPMKLLIQYLTHLTISNRPSVISAMRYNMPKPLTLDDC